MNLDAARDAVTRVERCLAGVPGQLPSNEVLRGAAAFLRSHLAGGFACPMVDELASNGPLVVSENLAQGMRAMLDELDRRCAADEGLRRRLAYVPNQVPRGVRTANVLLSVGLLAYGGLGLWLDDIYLPGKRSGGVHLHGEPAWMVFAAMLSGAANLLTAVIDHYDRRDNEDTYRMVARITQVMGWSLLVLAIILDLLLFRKGTR